MTDTRTRLARVATSLRSHFAIPAKFPDSLLHALLTREHAILLGPPGTAKSATVRALASHITDAQYFETLLHKDLPDSAVLGPYDLPLLTSQGAYVRRTEGYLPTAHIAFADECFRSSATLQNALLAALNERVLHEVRDGRSTHPIPLHSCFAASNSGWQALGEESRAFWDRMLFRFNVEPVSGAARFRKVMRTSPAYTPDPASLITMADLDQACAEVDAIEVDDATIDRLFRLKSLLDDTDFGRHISPRRWRKAVHVLQADAWIVGLDSTADRPAAAMSCLVPLLWDDVSQIPLVKRTIRELVSPEPSDKLAGANEEAISLIQRLNRQKKVTDRSVQDDIELADIDGRLDRLRINVEAILAVTPETDRARCLLQSIDGAKAELQKLQ